MSNKLHTIADSHYKNSEMSVYDISHEHLPDYSNYEQFANILIILLVLSLPLFSFGSGAINEFIAYMITINITRDVINHLTILPKTTKKCTYRNTIFDSIFGGCYDKIFSGHAATIFLITLLYYKYDIVTNIPVLVLINLLSSITLVLARCHYTIDIVVSFIVVTLMYTYKIKIPL